MRALIPLTLILALMTGCTTTTAQNAATLGTLAGATLGALTFKNKVSGAAIGAGTGLLVGYIVGNEMEKYDAYDERQITNTLETMPSGQASQWTNPDTRMHHQAIPQPARRYDDGRIERDVTLRARMPSGEMETVYAKAYRQPDGTWQLVQ
ncbi:glycine zipper domain-containing protein [uncultured Pseudodesulfovibrio sp.]|uniref:glycine zipper domain-containing protein n=1 Tax=uncultured Pseudodesulfovibrio sp. TaxID=2035858 RepID=UPI0029C77A02|nr:glycine zipper domain-containing protein [uncultured Pseudodesulfovibrio sp.]